MDWYDFHNPPIDSRLAMKQCEVFPLFNNRCASCRQSRWLELYPKRITDRSVQDLPNDALEPLCDECADGGLV